MNKFEYIFREIIILALLAVLIICVMGEPTDTGNLSAWIKTMVMTKAWAIVAAVCLWAVVRFWAVTPGDEKKYFGYEDEEEDYWA